MTNSKNKIKSSFQPFLDLEEKAMWVRKETLKLHKLASGIRIASCLSDIEIFIVLYYGGILQFDPGNIFWRNRDRFIVSKGHGAVSLFPILADLGFFKMYVLANHWVVLFHGQFVWRGTLVFGGCVVVTGAFTGY